MSESVPSNPFNRRGALRDPTQFFGRRAELDQIVGLLAAMQSISIVGERRIGKSSLLYYLAHAAPSRLPAGIVCIRLDVQRVRSEEEFYTRLLEALGADQGSTFRDLERALAGKQVVVCLDEFEHVAANEAFSVGFFDGLRSLAQENLALVTGTQHSLYDLCRDKRFAGSQFWNIFRRIDLGLFATEEAEEFIQSRFGAAGVALADEEVVRALRVAGCFPFFLQVACYHLFEEKVGRRVDWEIAFQQDADEHLQAMWIERTREERQAIRAVLNLGERLPDERLYRDLERRGLLVPDSQDPSGYWVFSEAFERIVRKPPPGPRTRRSVRLGPVKIELTPTPPWIKLTFEAGGSGPR